MMSVKFQMVLPDDLALRMKAKAKRKKIPLAQYVREAVIRDLNTNEQPHLFERLRGLGAGIHETDLASRVDEILYGGDPHS